MRTLLLLAPLALSACIAATPTEIDAQQLERLLPAQALLIGEQHDAPDHQRLQRQVIDWLAVRGQLAAVALEMAEQGHDTRRLPRSASEAAVQQALSWNDRAWPWANYGPAIMAAVRAGVPVEGANLPRARMKEAMGNLELDTQLPASLLALQQDRLRQSHCDLLPAEQTAPMTRIQIARDMTMAATLARLAEQAPSSQTVILITGNGHTHRALGVPRFLPQHLLTRVLSARARSAAGKPHSQEDPAETSALAPSDMIWLTSPIPPLDYCGKLQKQIIEKK